MIDFVLRSQSPNPLKKGALEVPLFKGDFDHLRFLSDLNANIRINTRNREQNPPAPTAYLLNMKGLRILGKNNTKTEINVPVVSRHPATNSRATITRTIAPRTAPQEPFIFIF